MFDSHTGTISFRFNINLDYIVDIICNIAFDITLQLLSDEKSINDENQIELAIELFTDELFTKLERKREDFKQKKDDIYVYDKDLFFNEITTYFTKYILDNEKFLEYLKGSEISFILKDSSIIYAFKSDKEKETIENRLKKGIIDVNVIDNLIDYLKNEKVKASLKSIGKLYNQTLYNNVINVTINKPKSSANILIEDSYLNKSTYREDSLDTGTVWINIESYKKKHKIDISATSEIKYAVSIDGNKQIGLIIDNKILPFIDINLFDYILPEKKVEFQWIILNSLYSKVENKKQIKTPLIESFLADTQDKKFNRILSALEKNMYLKNDTRIPVKYKHYFDTYTSIEELKYLDNFEFYISSAPKNKHSSVGIYAKEKIGIGTSYNLLHWLENKDNKLVHYRNSEATNKTKNLILILKPEITFYLLEKYFENLLEDLLKEINVKNNSNRVFTINKEKRLEIDSFVFCEAKNKLIIIEAKTTLNKDYIYKFLKKTVKIESALKKQLGLKEDEELMTEYLLLGSFSNEDVDTYQHFYEKRSGYNLKRKGYNTTPHYLNIPIPELKKKSLICIAEPEYDKLKDILIQLCQ